MKTKLCALILTLLVATAVVAGSISREIPTHEKQTECFVAEGGGNGTPPGVDNGI